MNTMKMPGFTAEMSAYKAINQYTVVESRQSPLSQVTPQACRRRCRDVVRPELCFWIPFPFCLIPQHECTVLCDPFGG